MRIFALVACLLCLVGQSLAGKAIVFISPSNAGPSVWPETMAHPLWIQWPVPTDGSGVNQLVAIATESEPSVSSSNFRFAAIGPHTFVNRVGDSLAKYFLPSFQFKMIAVSNFGEGIDQGILSMCACMDSKIEVADHMGHEVGITYLARVASWDQVAKVSRSIKEEMFVVEFPPPAGHTFSRLWVYRSGNLVSSPNAGVIKASHLQSFDMSDASELRNPGGSMRSGPPDRWLAVGELSGLVRAGVFIVVWLAAFVSIVFLSQERSNLMARTPLYAAIATVGAWRIFPIFCLWSGIGLWGFWFVLIALGIFGLLVTVDRGAAPNSRSGVSACLAIIVVLSSLIPEALSPFGSIYSGQDQDALAWIGFQLSVASYLFVSMRQESGFAWAISMALLPALSILSYVQDNALAMTLEVVIFLWLVRKPLTMIAAGIGTAIVFDGNLIRSRVVWENYQTIEDHHAPLNYFRLAQQLFRPETGIALMAILISVLLASRFGAHRLQKAWQETPVVRSFCAILWIPAVLTIALPDLLGSLPWLVAFFYLFWTQEALRQLV